MQDEKLRFTVAMKCLGVELPDEVFDDVYDKFEKYRDANEALLKQMADALEDSQIKLHNAWNRIHCLPRTTDTVLANNIDSRMAANRLILAAYKGRG